MTVDTGGGVVRQWAIGWEFPHSGQPVVGWAMPQAGQPPKDSKVSKVPPQAPQRQNGPTGGALVQLGHWYPARRGHFSTRDRIFASCQPRQQFMATKADITPYQIDPT